MTDPNALYLWLAALVGGLSALACLTHLRRTPAEQTERRRWLTVGLIASFVGMLSMILLMVGLVRHWIAFPR